MRNCKEASSMAHKGESGMRLGYRRRKFSDRSHTPLPFLLFSQFFSHWAVRTDGPDMPQRGRPSGIYLKHLCCTSVAPFTQLSFPIPSPLLPVTHRPHFQSQTPLSATQAAEWRLGLGFKGCLGRKNKLLQIISYPRSKYLTTSCFIP